MKAFSIFGLFFIGVAHVRTLPHIPQFIIIRYSPPLTPSSHLTTSLQTNIKCYCTGDGDPDATANTCCTDGDGITFPDGVDRRGSWDGNDGTCILQTDGLGFDLNSYINAFAACCRSTGPQNGNRQGGNCFSL
ncbi:hypothetical protein BS50DRAFT_263837 [Corynespora cassiicola Philippines]|uniref:Uncharacterized protein n=1 Tax=Corynespora cassiicola Philippines TaxID=1448308 RepID=A0A2T2N0Y7_CORCC|nr:hypothetical protein BS50DRAFT_263837 [Corynespora cassiicola Philippines]